jgi:transcriptional regulator with XRE-family HTH domain
MIQEITRLRAERQRLGWTLQKLAGVARVCASDISKIERRRVVGYEPQLKRLAKAVGLPRERLLELVRVDILHVDVTDDSPAA